MTALPNRVGMIGTNPYGSNLIAYFDTFIKGNVYLICPGKISPIDSYQYIDESKKAMVIHVVCKGGLSHDIFVEQGDLQSGK